MKEKIDKAFRMLQELQGRWDVTLKDVCQHAGVTPGQFAYHTKMCFKEYVATMNGQQYSHPTRERVLNVIRSLPPESRTVERIVAEAGITRQYIYLLWESVEVMLHEALQPMD